MLADFGFTQRIHKAGEGEEDNIPKGHTLCYTPPEVLAGADVGPSTDWWAVGCLIYEYHHGLPPFYNTSEKQMTKLIMAGTPPRSPHIDATAWDLIERMLTMDPEKRVGGKLGPTVKDVQAHPYFEGMNWGLLHLRAIDVPR